MSKTSVFFRNDDVNRMEPGLAEVTELLNGLGIPVSHAVEPANLENDCRDFLLERVNDGVEIIQHGYAHVRHDVGEFGGLRSRSDQESDLIEGLKIMQENFGEAFFPAMSFPFGSYNEHTIPLLEKLGYPVVSCHWRHQPSRQAFYQLGRLFRRGKWMGKHVSHHLSNYPGTNVKEISVTISPICKYFADKGPTACEFRSLTDLQEIFGTCRRLSPVVGIVLHHRFRATEEALEDLGNFASWIKSLPGVEFTDLRGVYESRFSKEKGIR